MIGPAIGVKRWLDRLIVPLPRGGTILDLGCGGGEPIARYLVDHGFHVVGVDYDRHMIDLAHTRFARERWLHGDMRTIVLDETFDGVIAWNCLSAMSRAERGRMSERAAEWLKPGGRLLLTAEAKTAESSSDYRPGSLYHDDLDPTDYGTALAACGLAEIGHIAQEPACGGAGVWLARKS